MSESDGDQLKAEVETQAKVLEINIENTKDSLIFIGVHDNIGLKMI